VTPGDAISIDGRLFTVKASHGATAWFVETYTVKAARTAFLGKTKDGIWRYGRGGKVVRVEWPLGDARMERITARAGT
jgi:hypothetical protein